MNHFDSLPNELILEIFKNLNFTKLEIPDVQLVCKRFYSLSRHPSLHTELRTTSTDQNWRKVLQLVKQRPSIKLVTIVGMGNPFYETEGPFWENFLKSQFPKVNGTVSLPFGCLFVVAKEIEDMLNLLEKSQIDTLICNSFETHGSFDANSKNFLSNLKELHISEWERFVNNDLINIAKCCKLKSFSFSGYATDSASLDIFFESMKSTLTSLSFYHSLDFDLKITQHVLNSLHQCTKLTQLQLKVMCDKLQGNQLAKENLPLLKSLTLTDAKVTMLGEELHLRNFENWFNGQDFSQLTELKIDIDPYRPHGLLLNISNVAPKLIKLSLGGKLIGGSSNMGLLTRFLQLETFQFLSAPADLNSDNFREMLRSFEIGVAKLKEMDIPENEIRYKIPKEDFPELKRLAQKRGINLIFSEKLFSLFG